ncbi:MAG: hypothetical protein Q7T11_03520 [Deltaproteobacteria bacterium]|nr:hypothetical protein [Deltaproteobacteria bacterium]
MNTDAIKRAVMFGAAGTVAMTVYTYLSHYIHLPKVDFHGLIAGFLHYGTAVNWVAYFAVGAAFAYLYKAFFRDKLPAHSWMRGVVYAFVLWGAMGLAMPLFGMAFFAGSMHAALSMLIGFGFYGATVGYLYEMK